MHGAHSRSGERGAQRWLLMGSRRVKGSAVTWDCGLVAVEQAHGGHMGMVGSLMSELRRQSGHHDCGPWRWERAQEGGAYLLLDKDEEDDSRINRIRRLNNDTAPMEIDLFLGARGAEATAARGRI